MGIVIIRINAVAFIKFLVRKVQRFFEGRVNCTFCKVFVANQSSCFFLCSREHVRLVENRLYQKDTPLDQSPDVRFQLTIAQLCMHF